MPKYEVPMKVTVFATVTVEAENEDDAIDAAHDKFVLQGLVGNGGRGETMLGVRGCGVSVWPGEETELDGEPKEIDK